MAELLTLITSKPNWQTKINDPKILKKWLAEFSQQNINPVVLDLVISLLKQADQVKNTTFNDDESYDWVLQLSVDPKQISLCDCECKCKICQGRELEEDYPDSDYSDYSGSSTASDVSDVSDVECKCTPDALRKIRSKFMFDQVEIDFDLIDKKTKKKFMDVVKQFQDSIDIDYHPGSNNQVIDLIHPSMYSYIRGITQTANPPAPDVLFQWLPSEFKIKNGHTTILTYINGLNPITNSELYDSIENIFDRFIPKFEAVLHKQYATGRLNSKPPAQLSNCQVIVKLADTVLTPQSTIFNGGSWHLEGLPNEKIIATGIYYYQMENISSNYLNFRTTMTDSVDIDYPQSCPQYVSKHYGMTDDTATMSLGQIETVEDMCLVFPNFMQHKVSEFSLENKRKSGSRKILVFFLIDPSTRILSTADVNPQQELISRSDAELYRELLMFERKYEMTNQSTFYERGWSLCEH